jgi:hypothetical protein
MKKIFILLLTFNTLNLSAQKVTDLIYLTDSVTVYEGLMVEQAPAKYIRVLRFKEKDTVQVMLKNVWKMVKVYPVADTVQKKAKRKEERNTRTAFAELLGNGVYYSINFEQRLHPKQKSGWALRAGLNVIFPKLTGDSSYVFKQTYLGIPLGVNYLYGRSNHYVEWGAGITYFLRISGDDPNQLDSPEQQFLKFKIRTSRVMGNFTLGYRYISENNGLMFGLAFNPTIGHDFFLPLPSVKIGYRF